MLSFVLFELNAFKPSPLVNFLNKFLLFSKMSWNGLFFREKKLSRRSSLKVLDYAMQGAEGAENCSKFIEFLGLRSLFPLFMKVRNKSSNFRNLITFSIWGYALIISTARHTFLRPREDFRRVGERFARDVALSVLDSLQTCRRRAFKASYFYRRRRNAWAI